MEPSIGNTKRSHQDMDDNPQHPESSATPLDDRDVDLFAPQSKASTPPGESSAPILPSTPMQRMLPPPIPSSSKQPLSPSTPQSAQRPPLSAPVTQQQQPQSADQDDSTTTPRPAREVQDSASSLHDENGAPDAGSSLADQHDNPQDSIEDFDWADLSQRYHDQIARLDANEQKMVVEFNSLCKYFGVWASTSTGHEVDRSFKRLKTQMTLVQHHEDQLEQKRQHYIKVVQAFQSALMLLGT